MTFSVSMRIFYENSTLDQILALSKVSEHLYISF
jgi:hypothetical protein